MADSFAFGTRHVVSQLKGDNAVLNGLIGVSVGIEDTVPKRIRLMLSENKIILVKPEKLSPAPDFPPTAQPPAPTTPHQSTGVAESPPPAPVKRQSSGSGALLQSTQTHGKRAKIEIPNLDGTYVHSSEKLTLEQMADAMGCSWRVLLFEFGKGLPKSIIRPWYSEQVQIGWELAPLGVIRAACGSSPHDVASAVERIPLEEVVKNTDPKSVVFPNHWAKWC
jgi:hypothetical protein